MKNQLKQKRLHAFNVAATASDSSACEAKGAEPQERGIFEAHGAVDDRDERRLRLKCVSDEEA